MTLPPVGDEPFGYSGEDPAPRRMFFDARQTVISQYANSPIILSLIDAIGDTLDWQKRLDDFYNAIWNVETATGYGLDVWGRIVGVSRALYISEGQYLGFSQSSDAHNFGHGIFWGAARLTSNFQLTDLAYRRVILAKAALNITDGSIPAINAILRALFPGYGNVYVRDNRDMTMTFVFGLAPSKVDYAIVAQSGVLPKPIGVTLTIETP